MKKITNAVKVRTELNKDKTINSKPLSSESSVPLSNNSLNKKKLPQYLQTLNELNKIQNELLASNRNRNKQNSSKSNRPIEQSQVQSSSQAQYKQHVQYEQYEQYEQEDSNYWPQQQNNIQTDSSVNQAIRISLDQYFYQRRIGNLKNNLGNSCRGNNLFDNNQLKASKTKTKSQKSKYHEWQQDQEYKQRKQQQIQSKKAQQQDQIKNDDNFIDIQDYEEYKKIKSFNPNFSTISAKIEQLRRLALTINNKSGFSVDFQANYQMPRLQAQSDILLMMYQIIKNNKSKDKSSISKSTFENNLSSQSSLPGHEQQQELYLNLIQKLQQIKQTFQTKIEMLRDQIQFKSQIVQELKANESTLNDDIMILENRNKKLRKQWEGQENSSEQQQQNANEQQQDMHEMQSIGQNQQQQQQQQQQQKQYQQQPVDYEKQYLSIMQHYGLFNPQTNIIQQRFPKNKTQAMMLLNQIQAKIQKLQMQIVMTQLNE